MLKLIQSNHQYSTLEINLSSCVKEPAVFCIPQYFPLAVQKEESQACEEIPRGHPYLFGQARFVAS